MNIRRFALILVVAVISTSCSEKSVVDWNQNSQTKEEKPNQEIAASKESEAKEENELQPAEDEIAEDCVAFLRSTKTMPAHVANADCPQCPANTEAKQVLRFDDIRVDRVSRSESTCEVQVTMHATFNPSAGENITGGLTAWISPQTEGEIFAGGNSA